MIKKNLIEKISDYPLIYILAIYYVVYFFGATNFFHEYEFLAITASKIQKYLRLVCCVIFLIYFYLYKKEKKQLIYFVLFILYYLFIKKFIRSHLLFDLFFIPLFLSQFINKERLCKVLLIVSIVCFAIIATSHQLGYIHTESYSRLNLIRHTFGFVHPNTLGFIVLLFSFLLILRKEKVNIKDIVYIIFLMIFTYLFPRSMTPTFLMILLLCFLCLVYFYGDAIYKYFSSKRRKDILFYYVVFIILATLFITYFISITGFGKEFFLQLPGSINARFELGNIAYERYGLSLFGTPIISVFPDPEKNITEYFTVDCAYFYIPINYGLVTFISYLFFILFLIRQAVIKGNFKSVFVLLLIVFYGVSEIVIIFPFLVPIFVCACSSDKNSVLKNNSLKV